MPEKPVNHSDLGRRIAHRRNELGLSVEAVAKESDIDPSYLSYLEQTPGPDVGIGVVLRLASALETTVDALLGSGFDRPPGPGPAGRNPVLEHMESGECWGLLAEGGVGRLVFVDADGGPSALPLNFATIDHRIVFRTAADSPLQRAGDVHIWVGFEVDRIDEVQRTGWSILVRGQLRAVTDDDELELLKATNISPWAGGERDRFFSVEAETVSGRRIEASR